MAKTLSRSGLAFTQPIRAILQAGSGLLLFSGGPDSTALFHLLLSQKKQKSQSFAVLHVNYGLRQADSLADEKHVRSLCRQHGIVCHVRRVKLSGGAGLQQRARLIRRRLATQVAKKYAYRWLATAHHLDDQIETLMMRQARGAGLMGMVGIREISHLSRSSIKIVRPLLSWTKVDILAWLREYKLDFREDLSNRQPTYTRNRIRLALAEKKMTMSAKRQLAKISETLSHFDAYFTARSQSLTIAYGDKVPDGIWSDWPDELRFRHFAERMRHHGYKGQIQETHYQGLATGKFNLGPAKALHGGKFVFFGGKILAQEKHLAPNGAWYLNSWGLAFSLKTLSGATARRELKQGTSKSFYLADPGESLVLSLGNPQEKIIPFGRKRARPLGEWLKASGLPALRRHSAPVLRTLSGQILFIFDTGLSNNARILPHTQRALAVSIL